MISDSGGAGLKLTGADCRVWCVISNVRRCELMRQNVRQEGMPWCMHVAPRWGLRWYNFTILISHDHNSREWTIQTFLFHELFLLAIFLSNPILWVSRSRRRILDTVGEAPDPFWDEHTGGSHVVMVSWCHGVMVSWCRGVMVSSHSWLWSGFNQPGDRLMTRSPRQSNGNLTRSASKKSNNPPYYVPFHWANNVDILLGVSYLRSGKNLKH